MPYTLPNLTRAQVSAERDRNPRPADCPQCSMAGPVDHWPTTQCQSSFRRDEKRVERVFRAHCTCASCF